MRYNKSNLGGKGRDRMNVTQMARNQQMIYRFIDRSANSSYASMMGALSSSNKTGDSGAAGLLQSMGLSGLQGRTVREMAQYQMRVQNAQSAAQPTTAATETAAAPQRQFSVREQYTPISDEATEAMQKLALEDAKNSIGNPTADAAARADLIREQLKGVDPSRRTAAFNTMNKVWESETDRLANFIQEKDKSWQDWGDAFDTSILDDYKAGVNVWV